jgi:hypothetical protein
VLTGLKVLPFGRVDLWCMIFQRLELIQVERNLYHKDQQPLTSTAQVHQKQYDYGHYS